MPKGKDCFQPDKRTLRQSDPQIDPSVPQMLHRAIYDSKDAINDFSVELPMHTSGLSDKQSARLSNSVLADESELGGV